MLCCHVVNNAFLPNYVVSAANLTSRKVPELQIIKNGTNLINSEFFFLRDTFVVVCINLRHVDEWMESKKWTIACNNATGASGFVLQKKR